MISAIKRQVQISRPIKLQTGYIWTTSNYLSETHKHYSITRSYRLSGNVAKNVAFSCV